MDKKTENDKKDNWLVKAYKNHEFLNSPAARTIRILTEMVEPAERLRKHNIWNTVVFFGSARTLSKEDALKRFRRIKQQINQKKRRTKNLIELLEQADRDLKMSLYYEEAAQLSKKLTQFFNLPKNLHKHFYICSGGGPGIMEAANKGAKLANGKSVGLNISLPMEQYPNLYQTREISFEFHYFFIRKFWFFYLAKALVVFPGGFGTLDELFELLTLIQTNKTKKYMPVILYGSEYWNELINFNAMLRWGMISPEDLQLFKIIDGVDNAYNYLIKELSRIYFK